MTYPYVVGISGTHGTGKSSVFNALAQLHSPPYNLDRTQLSRSAQKALGWSSLSVAQESEDNVWALQNKVLESLVERDERIINSRLITLVERTPLDVWAYMVMWCKKLSIDIQSDRVQEFRDRCISAINSYSHIAIIPISDTIPFVFDPARGPEDARVSAEDDILRLALDILDVNNHDYSGNLVRFKNIHSTSIRDRAEEVSDILKDAGIQYMYQALYAPRPVFNQQ